MEFLIFLAIVFGIIYVLIPFFIWAYLSEINKKFDSFMELYKNRYNQNQ